MYIPEFMFEEEDIDYLLKEDIFLNKHLDKGNGVSYFKLNPRKFNELIDIVYSNGVFEDRDKTDIEFDLRIVTKIFTAIIEKKDSLSITDSILGYYKINPENAKRLMTCVSVREDVKGSERFINNSRL